METDTQGPIDTQPTSDLRPEKPKANPRKRSEKAEPNPGHPLTPRPEYSSAKLGWLELGHLISERTPRS
jgi:hypothetical protein